MALELRQQQKQNLSQRMIQSVQILQMTSQELESYVDELALENPALEVEKASGESIDHWRVSHADSEQEHYLTQRQRNDDDYDPRDSWNFNMQHEETLKDYLWSQIRPGHFSKGDVKILDYLLDNLDEKGYLTETAAAAAAKFGTDEADISELIDFLQGLEPAGVCARNLSECLKIQLDLMGLLNDDLRELADQYLELVAKNKVAAIAGKLGVSKTLASKYCALIKELNPKPGSRFYHQENIQYIIPDVYVTRTAEGFEIRLNSDGIPAISVNAYYQNLRKTSDNKEVKEYLDTKIRQTEWVRQCIAQRQMTMTRVSQEIVRLQLVFFEHGPEHIRPLKMTEVAEALEIHESTVSRAIDKKYLQCSWGVFPMNYFFKRKATARDTRSAATEEQSFTSDRIKQVLREIVESENTEKPYSDRILSEQLAARGISISRRTVAKYRDEAGIPDASGRKNSRLR